jgi:hypothetical protein
MTGLASGLVETMREIGGAVGVAAVSTVLVSRAGVNAFHAAFWVLFVVAALASRGAQRKNSSPSRLRPTFRSSRNRPKDSD